MATQKTSKAQLKLKLIAKKAEAEAKKVAVKSAHKLVKPEEDSTTVSFDQWWMALTKRSVKIRPHLKEIFWADFKSRGCSNKETSQKYYELLDNFGYKY